ncbi:MAG: RNA methyltransferase, partial [Cellulosilyticaceae bacterium]
MITTLYQKITNGEDTRKNLIELRKLIKEPLNNRVLYYELDGQYDTLYKLLADEDAKVRKNVALIMGELEV